MTLLKGVSMLDNFLHQYSKELRHRYAWAQDDAKLKRYMNSVEETIKGSSTWTPAGDALQAAFKTVGGDGKVSLKKLRELVQQ